MSGDGRSCCTGCAIPLTKKRAKFATALEHCDMVAATLTGVSSPAALKRSICAMGHKWMWNSKWDGFPPEEFFAAVDPMLRGVRAKMQGQFLASDRIYGKLTEEWAEQMQLGRNCRSLWAHWTRTGMRLVPGASLVMSSMSLEHQRASSQWRLKWN